MPGPPPAARVVFGDRLSVAVQYAELLAGSGVVRGLIGPRETPRLWERHILNCAVMTSLIGDDASVIDVGSGAGLPGLVIAIRRPDLQLTLVEPLLRRASWLDEVVEALGVTNVRVVRGRAEALWDALEPADVVTSRAVSALDNLAVWSVPLVRPGGLWLPMKGASVGAEIDRYRDVLTKVGVVSIDVIECGGEILDEPTTVARLEIGSPRRLAKSATKKPSRRKKQATQRSSRNR
ncbi:16S rRNA (guanine(527)-N(7))-methyltransferase RsmG [Flexivirga caeni]|uniref:Ribosomal RNA small subunit methyltransferase G n=1 Tax=Flexivirga caeni TaxID=2294115 RepID=A0A3M9M592_9MICO|nr:16S rRNA (guanine(527)-N(7))-methyltransferase RsmG [Flexivirga caeni]RNI19698.1 16S rRNA (guanine(527)-N(7))-methyltransferase RsmG [Flexivirga caeni]